MNELKAADDLEMVMDSATADAIRQALRSVENDELIRRQTGARVISLQTALALQTDSSRLKKSQRRLWLALALAGIGWMLAALLVLQQLAAQAGHGNLIQWSMCS